MDIGQSQDIRVPNDHLKPMRYMGLRITAETEDEAIDLYKQMEIPNRYFYAFHRSDNGCKHNHIHVVILRDWDPTIPVDTRSKQFRRKFVSKCEIYGNKAYAVSYHTNTLVEAGNYLAHDPDAVVKFSESSEWAGFDQYKFEYVEYAKADDKKPDTDIHKRRRDLDHIQLGRYNLISTMQRYDRIKKRPKRSFKEALDDLMLHTRYRLGKDLLAMTSYDIFHFKREYESGVREAYQTLWQRWGL